VVRFIVVCFLLAAGMLCAQDTMEVDKTSGAPEFFDVNAISKITFTSTDMVIAGPGSTIPISSIALLMFHGDPVPAEKGAGEALLGDAEVVPNPFNPSASLRFALVRPGLVSIRVYDASGKKVRSLQDGNLAAGRHACVWDGRDDAGRPAGSGVYQILLNVDSRTAVKRAVLVR
jgi:hypothetical protein